MVNVLIVDDSPSVRLFLAEVLRTDPDIRVVGTAGDGIEAVAAVAALSPDVVTMDIYMPHMDGLEATRLIMETHPTPIIILSGSLDQAEVMTSFRAIEAGALIALQKPNGAGHPDHEQEVCALARKVKLMAEVKVVKRWPRRNKSLPDQQVVEDQVPVHPQVAAIGASTGGPMAIQLILAQLSPHFPVPVLIVQHMAAGFVTGFAVWLALTSRLPVHVASQGEQALPGHVYIAPDGFHMLFDPGGRIKLSDALPEDGLRPSISALFRSVADVCGSKAVAVLLSGMGRDGAEELLQLKKKGAMTIAQDRNSSVIYGMPGEAVRIGGATRVLPLEKIASTLNCLKV